MISYLVSFLLFCYKIPMVRPGGNMFFFIFGLFVGCSLGVFLTSMLIKSKEADQVF